MGVCVLGSINLDNVCRVARLPAPGETLMAESFERFAGGKGANQAVAAAAWGAPTALIGAVGRDEAGDRLIAHLEKRGIDVSAVARLAEEPTGQAHICVSPAGENTIVVIGGANRAVTAAQVAQADIAGRTVFLSQLETPLDAIETLFRSSAARKGFKILNAAPAAEPARALFPFADVVVLNQGELAFYADGVRPAEGGDAIGPARRLLSRPGQTIIVTLGAAGALAVTAESHILAAAPSARVVDTTGAGDCFCGVLAAALAEGGGLAEALALANQAAALSTENPGASVPSSLRVDAQARLRAIAR
ncbi:MAG: ribokinase [Caulobacteraceae bacterium]|jgi:ribokinase|nr:ribokinase [Caulobacteraceae bacterium]